MVFKNKFKLLEIKIKVKTKKIILFKKENT